MPIVFKKRPIYFKDFKFNDSPIGKLKLILDGPYECNIPENQDVYEPYSPTLDNKIFPFTLHKIEGKWFKQGEIISFPWNSPKERFYHWGIRFIRKLGRNSHPTKNERPQLIVVLGFNSEPYNANNLYDTDVDIIQSIEIIRDFFSCNVLLITDKKVNNINKIDYIMAPNKYPAHFPEAYIPHNDWQNTWVMDLTGLEQTLASIKGTVPPPMVIGVGGNAADIGYYGVYPGILLKSFIKKDNAQIIKGGILTGSQASIHDSVSFLSRGIAALLKPQKKSFLWWLNIGLNIDSISPTFLSYYLSNSPTKLVYKLNGEKRYCISCGYCRDVCPAGLDPELLWKLVKSGNTTKATKYGLNQCYKCNLCSYVCPSKIDLPKEFFNKNI